MKIEHYIEDIIPISTNTEPRINKLRFTATGNHQEIQWLNKKIEQIHNLFTKEQVEELLKQQREICSDIACVILPSHPHLHCTKNVNTASIYTAPSPSLEGEKK